MPVKRKASESTSPCCKVGCLGIGTYAENDAVYYNSDTGTIAAKCCPKTLLHGSRRAFPSVEVLKDTLKDNELYRSSFEWAVSIGPKTCIMGCSQEDKPHFVQIVANGTILCLLHCMICTQVESNSITSARLTVCSDHYTNTNTPLYMDVTFSYCKVPFILFVFRHFIALKQSMNYRHILGYLGSTDMRIQLRDKAMTFTHPVDNPSLIIPSNMHGVLGVPKDCLRLCQCEELRENVPLSPPSPFNFLHNELLNTPPYVPLSPPSSPDIRMLVLCDTVI